MKVLAILLLCFNYCFAASDPRCNGVPSGEIYLFPYPGDCTKYVECTSSGEATTRTCSNGEYFNEALQSCDHPDSSGCVPLTCPPGIVDYYSYPGDCTRYVECYQGTAEIHNCPADFYFNAGEKRCVSAPESGCGAYSSTRVPDWTTPHHEACWGVLPGVIELKRVDGHCDQYIECVGATATELTCPSGLYFDSRRQMCDHPGLADCSDPSTPSPIAPPGIEVVDDPRCANGNTDYWAYPDCTQFIECYNGLGYIMSCPSGLHFNETMKICEDPTYSACGRTTRAPDPWTTIPSNIDPDCPYPTTERYLFPFPGDCTKFMECIDAQKVVQNCPDGLYFNPTLMVCDYPYEAGCAYA